MRTKKIQSVSSAVCLMAAALLGFRGTPAAQAQPYTVATANYVSGATLTNSATWSQGGIVPIDKNTMVGLVVKFQGVSAATSNIVTTLARSADGVNFETSPPSTLSFTNALNGTNVVTSFWQIPRDVVGSAQSLKLFSVQNFSGSVNATNATIAIVKKRESSIWP